jgi:2-C-methyl-D-erythritol 4-phosphate cytidylyltransferase/2-C-methyl-D-erythritol 2,4-cyclodiphosphate synthase
MNIWAIILAAGQGKRLAEIKEKKQFLQWRERPLYWHSAQSFSRVPDIKGVIFVFPEEAVESQEEIIRVLSQTDNLGLECRIAAGGRERQDSSFQGLQRLPRDCTHVLIHDAARPLISATCTQRVIQALKQGARGVVPGLPVTETIKQAEGSCLATLPRDRLYAVQTPQGFERKAIEEGHRMQRQCSKPVTDDAALLEISGQPVQLVQGDPENIKITHSQDLMRLRQADPSPGRTCIGWGYDVHRFGSGKPLKLGGIPISSGPEVQAHSDGDVLLHALIDALLGCLAQGDIGDHFPDSNPALENINSGILLQETLDLVREQHLILEHVDLTLITQIPRIAPWKQQIKKNLLALLDCEPGQLNLKATTEEGLGFTGEKQGIKAVAQVIGRIVEPSDRPA